MRVRNHGDLEVYRMAFDAAMEIFRLTGMFPKEERYSLVDQIRRSSRSVCANIAEAFEKRLYPAHFRSKLSDSLSEAGETQVWLEFSSECGYLESVKSNELFNQYAFIKGKLITMMQHPEEWRV